MLLYHMKTIAVYLMLMIVEVMMLNIISATAPALCFILSSSHQDVVLDPNNRNYACVFIRAKS